MDNFTTLYKADCQRNGGVILKFLYYFRRIQTTSNPFLRKYYKMRFRKLSEKRGLEIPYSCRIGKGLYLGHAFNITIHHDTVIGNNCNIHKGVTIGQENRGDRKGCPTIGNQVYIGINAVVSGKITIGDDVLIGPNCHVNCDVPSHSIVIGNPCIIKHREWVI